MSDWLFLLVKGLYQTELKLTAEDVADAFWLAPRLKPDIHLLRESATTDNEKRAETLEPVTQPQITQPEGSTHPATSDEVSGSTPSESLSRPGEKSQADSVPVHARLPGALTGDTGQHGGVSIRIPTATPLPNALKIAQMLRPFRRREPSHTQQTFDEIATVERIAEEQLWSPVMRPAPERWLDISLVVDEGASMGVWRSTIRELRTLLKSMGAFRTVRTWRLLTEDGLPKLYAAAMDSMSIPSVERQAGELVDPNGRHLILVISDCVSRAWQDNSVVKLLNSWARWNPVVLLQVLPEYMWARTALRRAEPVGLVASRPAVANAGLKKISWKDSSLRDVARDEVPVPVVALKPSMLGTWAQWMVNSKQDIMPGFVLKSSAEKQSDRSKNKIVSPEERIKHFWAVASPTARRLATLMTVIPLFNLHILRLVRESSLDQKGQQIHEAEFILSGLIQIKHKHIDPDEVFYEFYEGVVPLLRDALPAPDAIAVLKELFLGKISHYIGEHLGQIRDFQAALATPKAYKGKLLPVDNNSFARILIDDLRWLGGDYADLVRESSEVDIEIQLDEITTGDVSMNVSVEMRDTPKCVVQSSQFWERLLRDIRRHVVVPIVGKDLLTIEVDGRSITLERFLAEKLAESCGKPLGDNQDLRHAIALYKESTNDPKLKYLRFHISKILPEQPPPIPKPLLQLAVIDGFTLYVTTYFDSLLHQALLEAKRCRANELQALAFDPKRGSGRVEEGGRQWDLFPDFKLDRQQTPVVYHLFGMDGPDPDGNDREDYAVTEEDLLEYLVLAVQPHHQPSKLFEILHSSRLLVLGTSYPDWLARFFLRLVTAQRLSAQHNARQLWVDRQCDSNSELAFFLQDYSMDTDLCFSEDPVRFVDLLHQKWQAFKTVEESKPTGSVSTPRAWETKRGKIFISYASEDRTVMETFAGALEKAGLDIWWDKNIEAARKWEEFIEQQIEEACVFVALLSHHTTDPGISAVVSLRPSDRVFRREWKAAFERNENFFALIENLSFLFISMMSIGILLALKNLWKKNCKELKHRTETRLSRF